MHCLTEINFQLSYVYVFLVLGIMFMLLNLITYTPYLVRLCYTLVCVCLPMSIHYFDKQEPKCYLATNDLDSR